MRCHQPISIALMCQPFQECMRMLRQDAKRTMYAMMAVKDTRAHRSYAQMAPFSTKRNLRAIGGTTSTADKHKATISKLSWERRPNSIINFTFTSDFNPICFSVPVWTLTQNTIRTFPKRRQKIYTIANLWLMHRPLMGGGMRIGNAYFLSHKTILFIWIVLLYFREVGIKVYWEFGVHCCFAIFLPFPGPHDHVRCADTHQKWLGK